MPEASPSVLVIRLDGIGDALALTPMLDALRERSIPADVLLSRRNAGIFAARAVRTCIVADFTQRSSAPADRAAARQLGRDLSKRGYTHALVATEDPSGYQLALDSAAPERIGFNNGWGKPFKTLWTKRFLTEVRFRTGGLDRRAPHESEVLFALARPLLDGARPTKDPQRLRRLVLDGDAPRDDRIAVQITRKWQSIGAGDDGVVDLLRRVAAAGPLRAIAAQDEAEFARGIAAAAGCELDTFSALAPWKSAIAASRALVAPDSGAMHVAGMTGTPVVGVFPAARDYALQTARWAPWAAPHELVPAAPQWPEATVTALERVLLNDRP